MRNLVILLLYLLASATFSFGMNETSFEEFMQSREVVATFYFRNNAELLTKAEMERVSNTISAVRSLQESGRMIRVEGYSSPDGDREKNFRLSFFRAKFVADILEDGDLPSEITLTGYGDLKANKQDPGKQRRVEIASYVKPAGMKKVKIAEEESPKTTPLPQATRTKNELQEIDSYKVEQAIRRKVDDKTKNIADQLKELEEQFGPGITQGKVFNSEEDLERGYTLWRKSIDPDYSPRVTQVIKKDKYPHYGYFRPEQNTRKEAPKLGQAEAAEQDLQRGYSQVGEESAKNTPELGQAKAAEQGLQHGYSQAEAATGEKTPEVGQVRTTDNELQRSLTRWVESIDAAREQNMTMLWPADAPPSVDKNAPDVTMVLPEEMAPAIDALMIEQAIMDKIGVTPTASSGSITQFEPGKAELPVQ